MALKVDSALFTASALDVARSRGSASPSLLPVSSATWARTSPGRSARVTGRSSAPTWAFLVCSDAISEERRGVARGYFLPRGWAPVGCFKGLTALYPRDSGQMHSRRAHTLAEGRGPALPEKPKRLPAPRRLGGDKNQRRAQEAGVGNSGNRAGPDSAPAPVRPVGPRGQPRNSRRCIAGRGDRRHKDVWVAAKNQVNQARAAPAIARRPCSARPSRPTTRRA